MTRRKGHDPVHTFRVSAELMAEAREVASSRGESVSDVVRRALEEYVQECRHADIEPNSSGEFR